MSTFAMQARDVVLPADLRKIENRNKQKKARQWTTDTSTL